MALSKEQRLGEITALRTKMKSKMDLRIQVLAAISETFNRHGIQFDGDILSEITIAIPDELKNELSEVILPGGTNC